MEHLALTFQRVYDLAMSNNEKTYRELREELDNLLHDLQSVDIDVDDALDKFKKGNELITQLRKRLDKAETEIKKLQSK